MKYRLRNAGYKLKFCTNETTITKRSLIERLRKHGFTLSEEEVHSPALACRDYLTKNNLRPYLISKYAGKSLDKSRLLYTLFTHTVDPNALPDYKGLDTSNPNCVVIADATDAFTYQSLNHAFRLLISSSPNGQGTLISLGKGYAGFHAGGKLPPKLLNFPNFHYYISYIKLLLSPPQNGPTSPQNPP